MSSKELVVSQNRHEVKVGILEDGQLVEVYFQRSNEYSLAGSIHKGRVTRVLPGMQSAFVDLGLERDTFLYVSDFFEEHGDEVERVSSEERPSGGGGRDRDRDRDRDRERGGRDRDRDRERNATAPAPAAAVVAASAAPAAAPADEYTAQAGAPEASENAVAAPPSGDPREGQSQGDRDRRGRRSRRRRNRGRGFPDSKYAAPGEAADSAPGSDEPETGAAPSSDEEIFLLPGESLAKYRRSGGSVADADADTDTDTDTDTDADESAEAASEREEDSSAELEALRVAPDETEDDVVEQILERVDALGGDDEPDVSPTTESDVDQIELAAEKAQDLAESLTQSIEEGDETREEVEDGIDFPESTPAAQEESDEYEPLEADGSRVEVELELESGSDIEDTEAYPGSEDESAGISASDDAEATQDDAVALEAPKTEGEEVEPARMPQSLTATLRAQGGRYPHRVSRRMRRRGRGGQQQQQQQQQPEQGQAGEATPEQQQTPLTDAPAPVREVRTQAERGPREERTGERERGRERDRDRDRDKDRERERSDRPPLPSITDLLREGQEIIVQIAKEPLGQKGARITSHIALPGRYVVYMPTVEHLGVSRKISTEEERLRLKKILQTHRQGIAGGFIMRTAGEGKSEEDIASDMHFLANLWLDIRQKAEKKRAPALLHHDVQIVQRVLRDQLTEGFKAIWVDTEDMYEQVLHTVERMQPSLLSRVKLYTRQEPIFDAFGITQELERALRPKVWLKSGGYIVINQTEALVAIDVNTGKYVGKSNRLEDTIVKTNLEAVKEIVRQMRLRDLGGIIVVDFIDMDERKNRQKVMQALEDTMRFDKAPYKILQFNDFGLVAITRKRVKQSLERTLCAPCPTCEGAGYLKSVQTVIGEILAQAQKYARVVDTKDCVLRVNPEVAKVLKSVENRYLEELEEVLGRPVLVTSDPLLHPEKFDLT